MSQAPSQSGDDDRPLAMNSDFDAGDDPFGDDPFAEEPLSADNFSDEATDPADLGDETDGLDAYMDEADLLDDLGDAPESAEGEAADVEMAWSEFEADIADALDAEDTEEFLGSILGGFSRAARAVTRNLGTVSGVARQGANIARGAGNVASGLGQLAQTAALAARWFGAPRAAAALQRFGTGARRAGGTAEAIGSALGLVPRARRALHRAGRRAHEASQAPNPLAHLLANLGQLMSNRADDFEAFDAMADLYAEEGVDEALPAAVALAARAAARALGWGNVSQLGDAARRALVRGVATAARTLVQRQGPQALRALPRIAQATSRVARRRKLPLRQLPQAVARSLPRTTHRVAQQPQMVRHLAKPMSSAAPLARPQNLGRGTPTVLSGTTRRLRLDGPVELTIRAL